MYIYYYIGSAFDRSSFLCKMSDDFRISLIDSEPFAEGRFRYAFKGVFKEPPSKEGQKVVVKKFKDSYIWERNGWDTTMKLYSTAANYANSFGRNIEYSDCFLGNIAKVGDSTKLKLDEYVANEEYLEGTFVKWCNNYGYVSSEARGVDQILTAFMHWTWARSKGHEMVADIQGVKLPNGTYKLTDPAMLSVSGKYGITDTGVEGMTMFFLIHQCTDGCKGLPKPTLAHFVGKIPDSMLQEALALQQLSGRGTTYSREAKFLPEIRSKLTEAFLAISK